ncbi:hypothetical protein GUJ93_ZPchr0013g33790 [Zizania palustris]|uniref:Glycosyltransferase n=1 Tax=Zizania palustris TaxID=103762 RepID=A0A8J5WRV1_ZIZPA|nr:hypothetical protein GUJ93_ZPchr0013g33790 [Zizania palustris]
MGTSMGGDGWPSGGWRWWEAGGWRRVGPGKTATRAVGADRRRWGTAAGRQWVAGRRCSWPRYSTAGASTSPSSTPSSTTAASSAPEAPARLTASRPGFRFAAIPDGLPPPPSSDADADADATQDIPSLCRSTRETCLPHFSRLLANLNADAVSPESPPVTCVVSDVVMSFALDAAREIGVPCALLWTASVCSYMGYRHYRALIDKGVFPFKDAEQLTSGFLDTPVDWTPGLSKHMRLKDIPTFIRSTDPDEYMVHFALHVTERLAQADAAILNTFDELEPEVLNAKHAMLPPTTAIHSIGPLPLLVEQEVPQGDPLNALAAGLQLVEGERLLPRLAGRQGAQRNCPSRWCSSTTVYGSITVMTNEELVEFAWGLANSGHDFLWVIRHDLVNGDAAVLPLEFTESTKGRGLLATWCPQEAVLRHEAVGVFLAHSGWNSTMESLCGGVPMLCWPFFADQQTNCRYSCAEWGVAIEIGHDVHREVVEAKIREAMGGGDKGREMRLRAEEWRDTGLRATRPGGRSHANLEALVSDVLLISGGRGKAH